MEKLAVLEKYFGYSSFRDGQTEIIDSILSGRETLAIMPTGGGKSICYQIPALMFKGLTIVISPLISLMKDQVDALKNNGISAACLNSSSSFQEQNQIISGIVSGAIKLIYVAPERLFSELFLDAVRNIDVSFVAVDEAHCISQWGHDFRKSYTEIAPFVESLQSNPVVSAFTATATPQVEKDIILRLKLQNPNLYITGFDRANLKFSVVTGENSRDFIDKYVRNHKDDSGIIYASTRKEVDAIYEDLHDDGYSVGKYHAGLTENQRKSFQDDFIYDKINIMVATNAFGMGIDKPNVRFVIHNNLTKDIESYYQEAGRAGRDGLDSECILIFNSKDIFTQNYFIDLAKAESSPEQILIKKNKLNDVIGYSKTKNCLREYILKYFGETNVKDECGNCSNCLSEMEIIDITVEAQKIISCVYRLPYAYGSSVIANVLKGSRRKEIIEKNLTELSTYGIMAEYSIKDIRDMINILINEGYLHVKEEFLGIEITPKAVEVIKQGKKVTKKILKVEKQENIDFEYNFDLANEIKLLRRSLAEDENVPPYIIFSDKVIEEIVKQTPHSSRELLNIKGMGEYKIGKYGDRIITICGKYEQKEFVTPRKHVTKKKQRAGSSAKESFKMYKMGYSIEDIAQERGIIERTVEGHIFDAATELSDIRIEDFITESQFIQIKEIVDRVGDNALSPIKNELPENFSYTMIKAALCKIRIEREQQASI